LFSLVATAVVFVFLAPRDGAEGVRRPLARWNGPVRRRHAGDLARELVRIPATGVGRPAPAGAVLAAWMLLALLVPLLELAAPAALAGCRWRWPAFGLAVLLGLSPATG